MLTDETLLAQLAPGRSVLVGTADVSGWPACCRGIAILVDPDGQGVTVYVPVATGAETVANVASTGRIAIICSEPVSHSTLQLKGRTRAVRVAAEHEAPAMNAWFDRFTDVLASIGLPRGISRAMSRWPAFAIEVAVEAVFEQTPGPRAGALVKSR
jgi:hypothetical protein